jgi:hypothetical protein
MVETAGRESGRFSCLRSVGGCTVRHCRFYLPALFPAVFHSGQVG